MSATQLRSHFSRIQFLLTLLGMAGIAALFLPFTYDTVPFGVAEYLLHYWEHGGPLDSWPFGPVWMLALPAFLSILVSAASLRWVISDSFSRSVKVIAYLAGGAMACVTLSFWVRVLEFSSSELDWPTNLQEWLSLAAPVLTILLGVYALSRNFRKGISKEFNVVLALQVPYLADCFLCLIAYFPHWQVGAYLALLTAAAYCSQIILVLIQRPAIAAGAGARG